MGAGRQRRSCRLLFVFLLIVLSSCSAFNSGETNGGDRPEAEERLEDELVLAIGGEPDAGFDPTTGWGRYGSPLFQSTLLKYDEDFNIQSDLAVDYAVSQDGLQWTVDIRDDVMFSDGEPLTAEDVVFTYQTAKESDSVIDLTHLDSIEAVNTHTVRFTLKEPDSTFIHHLLSIGIVPEHAYDHLYHEHPIGSGPYQMVQWHKGQQLIVEQNPYYYGEKPYFKKLTFLFLAEDAAFAAAKAGQADVVSVPPAFANEEVPGMKLVELDSVDNRGIMLPFIPSGTQTEAGLPVGHDVTADLAIRKALNIAVDREALVEGVLEGYGTPAYTVADHLPWWNPETVIKDGDMEAAKNILDEAGWLENDNGVREKDGLKAEFTLYYPANDHTRQSLSMAFAEMIAPLGIEVHTEGKSWNELEKVMYANPVMMGWGSHDPLEMYNLYSSETRGIGYYNANFYSNPAVDEYMQQAMTATTPEEANKYWQKAQWDGNTGLSARGDAPWVWLVNVRHLYFVRENLDMGEQKIQPHGHGWPVTDFITDWRWTD